MLFDTKTHIPKSLSSKCEYELPRKTKLLLLACCQEILITRQICWLQIKMNNYIACSFSKYTTYELVTSSS